MVVEITSKVEEIQMKNQRNYAKSQGIIMYLI